MTLGLGKMMEGDDCGPCADRDENTGRVEGGAPSSTMYIGIAVAVVVVIVLVYMYKPEWFGLKKDLESGESSVKKYSKEFKDYVSSAI